MPIVLPKFNSKNYKKWYNEEKKEFVLRITKKDKDMSESDWYKAYDDAKIEAREELQILMARSLTVPEELIFKSIYLYKYLSTNACLEILKRNFKNKKCAEDIYNLIIREHDETLKRAIDEDVFNINKTDEYSLSFFNEIKFIDSYACEFLAKSKDFTYEKKFLLKNLSEETIKQILDTEKLNEEAYSVIANQKKLSTNIRNYAFDLGADIFKIDNFTSHILEEVVDALLERIFYYEENNEDVSYAIECAQLLMSIIAEDDDVFDKNASDNYIDKILIECIETLEELNPEEYIKAKCDTLIYYIYELYNMTTRETRTTYGQFKVIQFGTDLGFLSENRYLSDFIVNHVLSEREKFSDETIKDIIRNTCIHKTLYDKYIRVFKNDTIFLHHMLLNSDIPNDVLELFKKVKDDETQILTAFHLALNDISNNTYDKKKKEFLLESVKQCIEDTDVRNYSFSHLKIKNVLVSLYKEGFIKETELFFKSLHKQKRKIKGKNARSIYKKIITFMERDSEECKKAIRKFKEQDMFVRNEVYNCFDLTSSFFNETLTSIDKKRLKDVLKETSPYMIEDVLSNIKNIVFTDGTYCNGYRINSVDYYLKEDNLQKFYEVASEMYNCYLIKN